MPAFPTLSEHILDICENAVNSGGNRGKLIICENKKIFSFLVTDNGRGMNEEEIKKALDPFYTTKKKKKKFGLGLPFLKMACELTGGSFLIRSKKNKGTKVKAVFLKDSIDCQPVGKLEDVLINVVLMSDNFDWKIIRLYESEGYKIDTSELKNFMDLTSPKALKILCDYIENMEKSLKEKY